MTGTISFPSTDPFAYPFPGSYPNPIPDSYPIPNYPMGRTRQEKDLRARLVKKCSKPNRRISNMRVIRQRSLAGGPSKDFLPGDSQHTPFLCVRLLRLQGFSK